MSRTNKYELLYIRFVWVFSVVGSAYTALLGIVFKSYRAENVYTIFDLVFFVFLAGLNLVRLQLIKKELFEHNAVYILMRFIELSVLIVATVYLGSDALAFMLIIVLLLITILDKGHHLCYAFVPFLIVVRSSLIIVKKLNEGIPITSTLSSRDFLMGTAYYLATILFVVLCSIIYKDTSRNEQENKRLMVELGEKYGQLAIAQDEVKYQYGKLKEANTMLEDTNKKLTGSIAEFYTLQQISQAISSIFDLKELLKYVNDIIIGVMGVNNSTIILYDEKKQKLKVHTTNIRVPEELASLSENVNSELLMSILENGKPLVENFVDPNDFIFTQKRNVCSLICAPLSTKSSKFGLVLIEHKFYNAFDQENLRLLGVIGQQVSIALENAYLYKRMQDLATIDGLTGVYNRLYLQDRLEKEFKKARDNNYSLSLAIMDADHFKKFNDIYGHLFGDKLLKGSADVIKSSIRNTDTIARFGGEEFLILFPRTTLKEAYEKVEAIRIKIARNTVKDSLVAASMTASFGVSSYPEIASSESELLRSADDALYDAKSLGRNQVVIGKKVID